MLGLDKFSFTVARKVFGLQVCQLSIAFMLFARRRVQIDCILWTVHIAISPVLICHILLR